MKQYKPLRIKENAENGNIFLFKKGEIKKIKFFLNRTNKYIISINDEEYIHCGSREEGLRILDKIEKFMEFDAYDRFGETL